MLLPPGGFKSQKNNSGKPCVPMFMTVEGFSARKIYFTAGYFPRLLAIMYIPGKGHEMLN